MLWTFFRFEWRCAWRFAGPAVLFLIAAGGTVLLVVNAHFGSWYANAPIVIEWFQAFLAMPVTLTLAAVFFLPSATRDFAQRTDELVFSAPIRKEAYLAGRFAGTFAAALVPSLGISAGLLVAPYVPGVHLIFGPVNWAAHREAFLLFTLPNLLIAGGCVFAFASWVRQPFTALASVLTLLAIGYGAPHLLLSVIRDHRWAAMADPFGWTTFQVVLERWQPSPGDPNFLTRHGLLLYNRCAWLGVAFAAMAVMGWRFDFRRRPERGKMTPELTAVPPAFRSAPAANSIREGTLATRQWAEIVRFDLAGMRRETLFAIMTLGLFAQGLVSFWGRLAHAHVYWAEQIPDLRHVLGHLDEFTPLIVVMLAVYAGYVVWRERTARIQEIDDALPVGAPIRYVAKLSVLVILITMAVALVACAGLAVALLLKGRHLHFGFYANQLIFWYLPFLLTLGVGALAIQAACPGKYAGYVACAGILVGNTAAWVALDIRSGLVTFAYRPFVSSTVQGAASTAGWFWFNGYWIGWCGLLGVATILLWPGGMNPGWKGRWRNVRTRWSVRLRLVAWGAAGVVALAGAVIYYNISVINGWETRREATADAIAYEQTYGRYAGLAQPVITDVEYRVDLLPERREFALEASEWLENQGSRPIGELHFTVDRGYETTIDVPNAFAKVIDRRLGYCIYRFFVPMAPGERRLITFRVSRAARGFENDVSHLNLTRAGTYLDWHMCPTLGYNGEREAQGKQGENARRKAGLLTRASVLADDAASRQPLPRLNGSVTISTAPSQVAVAPGTLEREWVAGGRRFFRYRSQNGALRFMAVSSATYRIVRSEAAGVKLALYYLPESDGNIAPIMQAFHDSVAYYARQIGPCPSAELRMVELSGHEDFAAAAPGVLFLSENQGFMGRPVPSGFNPLRYLVAYQLASQWWGHDATRDPIDTRWAIDTVQQYDACQIAAEGRYQKSELDWLRPIRADNLLPVPKAARLGHWSALGGLGLAYLADRCGEGRLQPALAAAHEAMRGPASPAWGLAAFQAALASQVPPEKRYLITHLERDILPLKLQFREATTHRRPDGNYETTVRLMVERERVEDHAHEPESPSGSVRLVLLGPALTGQPNATPPTLREITVPIAQTWTDVSVTSAKRPASVSCADDFDDWFTYDPTVFATFRRSILVTER